MAAISKAELIRLQKKLKTDARIGEEFGITRQAIHQLRKKYGIESRIAGNSERNTEIVALRDAGQSVEALAKKFSLSVPQTYRIIKETTDSAVKAAKKKAPAKKETVVSKAPAAAKKVAKKEVAKKAPAPAKAAKKKVAAKKKK
jgi:hypothetical protein